MDTGKILMGTALLLIMIGLVVHPAGAANTSGVFPVGQVNTIGSSGQVPAGSDAPCITGPVAPVSATHPYERLTTQTCILSVYHSCSTHE